MNTDDLLRTIKSKERRKNWKKRSTGTVLGTRKKRRKLPEPGHVKRYVLTSAQNNTLIHDDFWKSLTALAKHYGAEIIVGTFSYDLGAYGRKAVKRGTYGKRGEREELWYDSRIENYIKDERIELAPGLVWCGEMNIMPTAVNPLASLETYSARKSAIFPSAKMAMRSIPAMQGEAAKLNYTTGAVTKINYIAKRLGMIAQFHHVYGALLVEVNHDGHWWVRQLNADPRSRIQDLDVVADGEKVTTKNRVESITWGDLHATYADEKVVETSLGMLDELKPKFQFLHDVLEGASINRHAIKASPNMPHYVFHRWLRGLHRVDEEFKRSAEVIGRYLRPWCKTIAPDSNHDGWWLRSWLSRFDYRVDPANAELFLDLQKFYYAEIRAGKMPRDVDMMGYAFAKFGLKDVRFLLADESFKICGGKIECGMHGHLGPNGKPGSPTALSKMGRKANIAHTHAAGIYDGLYVAGTSSKMKWDYNFGPSNWTHSHIVTYPSGKRTIVTIYAGKWRA